MPLFSPPSRPLPAGYPMSAIDAHGNAIQLGALVRILTIPEWLTHDLPEEEVLMLKACEGTLMRVVELDAYGSVWFGKDGPWFCLRPCEVAVSPSDAQSGI